MTKKIISIVLSIIMISSLVCCFAESSSIDSDTISADTEVVSEISIESTESVENGLSIRAQSLIFIFVFSVIFIFLCCLMGPDDTFKDPDEYWKMMKNL